MRASAKRIVSTIVLTCCICAPAITDDRKPAGTRDGSSPSTSGRQDAAVLDQPALETLIDSGIRNPAMEYDLGNAYMRLGKAGLAILHYRRGLRMTPSDAKLSANLTYVRNRVQPFVEESDKSRLARSLLFWHYDTSLAARVWAVGILSGFGWLLLLVRLNRRRLPLLVPALLSIVVSLACCGSVVWELREIEREPAAVVCGAEHILRLGSGEGSDAAMSEPLGPGVELRVIGGRGEWVEVRLVDGREGWLPAEAIERI